MFVFLPSLLFLAIASAIPSGREDIVYPTVETLRSGERRVKFRALNQDVELRLEPAGDIFSEDFGLYEGEEAKEIPSSVNTLKNKLYKDKKKQAAIYIEDDEYTSIEGIIGEKMRIMPEETVRDGRRAHRVFEVKQRDGHIRIKDEIIPPGVKGQNRSEYVDERQSSKVCIVVEIVFCTESHFSGSFSSNEEYEKYLSLTIVYSQILFDTMSFKIKIIVIGFVKYTKTSEPAFIGASVYTKNPKLLDSEKLIDSMCKFYASGKVEIYHRADVCMLITLKEMAEYTLGIAYVGGVCDKRYKCAVSQDDPKNFNEYVNTCAHELAHSVGCPHDEEGPVSYISGSPGTMACKWDYGYIMSYKTNAQNGTKFSPCSSACAKHLTSLRVSICVQENC
nr:putative metalloprotease Tcis_Metallo_4 [Tityus cisandinus]